MARWADDVLAPVRLLEDRPFGSIGEEPVAG